MGKRCPLVWVLTNFLSAGLHITHKIRSKPWLNLMSTFSLPLKVGGIQAFFTRPYIYACWLLLKCKLWSKVGSGNSHFLPLMALDILVSCAVAAVKMEQVSHFGVKTALLGEAWMWRNSYCLWSPKFLRLRTSSRRMRFEIIPHSSIQDGLEQERLNIERTARGQLLQFRPVFPRVNFREYYNCRGSVIQYFISPLEVLSAWKHINISERSYSKKLATLSQCFPK